MHRQHELARWLLLGAAVHHRARRAPPRALLATAAAVAVRPQLLLLCLRPTWPPRALYTPRSTIYEEPGEHAVRPCFCRPRSLIRDCLPKAARAARGRI